MNILVCVKQVPDTTEIKIDPVTNTLIREGVPSIVNTFDGYALEIAARVRDKNGGTITILTMGPEQAKKAIKECLAVGADKGVLLSDRAFGGSDTLATSYVLSRAVRHLEGRLGCFDVVFCGKQAIDGDTGQVGPELAAHLGRPQVTYASDVEVVDGELRVKRESDEGYDIISCPTPAVVTVVKTAYEPRNPTIKGKLAANRAEIPTLTAADFEIDTSLCGLNGSPTKVKKTYTPARGGKVVKIQESDASKSAAALMAMLSDAKIL
ncbi:MAG: electron transfer flavoprotein subunit beta/FixA family protein [Oscillospiraceae bacterium]|nr:electron transfer flavoprotein subunit beta/FixA family protein [Oscillospiraceae bacterium]